jgi:hypothetical protein
MQKAIGVALHLGCAAAPEKTNLVVRREQDAIKFSVGE